MSLDSYESMPFSLVIRFSSGGKTWWTSSQRLFDSDHSTVISNSQKVFLYSELRSAFSYGSKDWASSMEVANPFTKHDFQKRPHLLFILPKPWGGFYLCNQMVYQPYSDHLPSQTHSEPRSHSLPGTKPVSNQFSAPREDHSLLWATVSFSGPKGADRSCLMLTALDCEQKLKAKTFWSTWHCPWSEYPACSCAYFKIT